MWWTEIVITNTLICLWVFVCCEFGMGGLSHGNNDGIGKNIALLCRCSDRFWWRSRGLGPDMNLNPGISIVNYVECCVPHPDTDWWGEQQTLIKHLFFLTDPDIRGGAVCCTTYSDLRRLFKRFFSWRYKPREALNCSDHAHRGRPLPPAYSCNQNKYVLHVHVKFNRETRLVGLCVWLSGTPRTHLCPYPHYYMWIMCIFKLNN